MTRVPTYLDRYPAKMVSHLAEKLVNRFALDAELLLDCFCGSGAIVHQGLRAGVPVLGLDINPYAVLLSRVKLEGFDTRRADTLLTRLKRLLSTGRSLFKIGGDNKHYWFTKGTIIKFERLRFAARELKLASSPEGRALLLAVVLSVRLCSRADQRSPKPFISRRAREARSGRHYDPIEQLDKLYASLRQFYGDQRSECASVICADIVKTGVASAYVGRCSHLITSPPYINAQDYFRNFKLELSILEGLLPFDIDSIKNNFIGTERGLSSSHLAEWTINKHRDLVPELAEMESSHPKQAAVVHRYFADMACAFDNALQLLSKNCKVVLVCGDNLVGGYSISTWRILNVFLEERGFRLEETFGDDIACRNVAPHRLGHKGLIKREVVSSFTRRVP